MNAEGQSHSQSRSLHGLPGTIGNDEQSANVSAVTRFGANVTTLPSREQVLKTFMNM